MVVKFYGPFEDLAEKEVSFELKKPVSIQEMLQMIADRYPGFAQYCAKKDDVDLAAHVMIVCNGKPLRLMDRVDDKDAVNVLLPVTGG